MIDKIFTLWRVYEISAETKIAGFEKFVGAFSSEGKMYYDFETFIGIFSNEEKCQAAIAELLTLGYFSERPEQFVISEESLHAPGRRLGWSDGFVSLGEEDE